MEALSMNIANTTADFGYARWIVVPAAAAAIGAIVIGVNGLRAIQDVRPECVGICQQEPVTLPDGAPHGPHAPPLAEHLVTRPATATTAPLIVVPR